MVSQVKVDKILESTSSAGVHIPSHVIQTVTGTYNTAHTTNETSYTDTNLSVTITPKYASSKILLLVQHYTLTYAPGTIPFTLFQLLRDSTVLTTDIPNGMKADDHPSDNNAYKAHSFNLTYLDSPNSTSAITYKTQAKHVGSGDGYVINAYAYSGTPAVEHLIAMEIAQ